MVDAVKEQEQHFKIEDEVTEDIAEQIVVEFIESSYDQCS